MSVLTPLWVGRLPSSAETRPEVGREGSREGRGSYVGTKTGPAAPRSSVYPNWSAGRKSRVEMVTQPTEPPSPHKTRSQREDVLLQRPPDTNDYTAP